MKKALVILIFVGLNSCKKAYFCGCTSSAISGKVVYHSARGNNQTDAKSACDEDAAQINAFYKSNGAPIIYTCKVEYIEGYKATLHNQSLVMSKK